MYSAESEGKKLLNEIFILNPVYIKFPRILWMRFLDLTLNTLF
jgi:hypothetical protein